MLFSFVRLISVPHNIIIHLPSGFASFYNRHSLASMDAVLADAVSVEVANAFHWVHLVVQLHLGQIIQSLKHSTHTIMTMMMRRKRKMIKMMMITSCDSMVSWIASPTSQSLASMPASLMPVLVAAFTASNSGSYLVRCAWVFSVPGFELEKVATQVKNSMILWCLNTTQKHVSKDKEIMRIFEKKNGRMEKVMNGLKKRDGVERERSTLD